METKASHDKHWYSPIKNIIPKPRDQGGVLSSTLVTHAQPESSIPPDAGIGPYAKEKRMPRWLVRVLEKGDKSVTKEQLGPDGIRVQVDLTLVETPGLIPALARLSNVDSSIFRAAYSSPHVHHVAKLRREGSFCGYRNIQIMITYIRNARVSGHQQFDHQPLPSIFTLQKMIEKAWENGFNISSRADVGYLQMTRKFIGTSEAEALFLSLGIPVITRAFVSSLEVNAYEYLIEYVSDYFNLATTICTAEKVVVTQKAPIFLQRSGHSMTIVGIEEDTLGSRSLIVFDPKYRPSMTLKEVALGASVPIKPRKLLKAHRYGASELARYPAFEIVQLTAV